MIENLISSNPNYENAIQLLCTIPSVKRDSAVTIISQIGIDVTQFYNSKHLCCWADFAPGSNESAGKKKSVRITHAGVYLKSALIQCAHVTMKSDKFPYYKKKYESLVRRRGKKRTIITIARRFSLLSNRCCLLVNYVIRAIYTKLIFLHHLLKSK